MMKKTTRINVGPVDLSDHEDGQQLDSTTVCYQPFNKLLKGTDPYKRKNRTRAAELISNSLVSLSLAIAKLGPGSIHQSIKEGLIDDLERALKSSYYQDRINYPNQNGLTFMHQAAIYNQGNVIDCLVRHGAETNITIGHDEETPLHLAAKHNSGEAARALIRHGAGIETANYKGSNALHIGCEHGCNEAIEIILADVTPGKVTSNIVNAHDKERVVPLHLASKSCNIRVIALLLRFGANIYKKDIGGHTALHLVAKRKRTDIMQLLLRHAKSKGNNDYVSIANGVGLTPIHFAVDSGSIENTELCIQYGADIESQSNDLVTPLHIAALNGFHEIASRLINQGIKVDTPDCNLRTGLHYAAISNNVEIMKLLVDNGAHIEAADDHQQTPLMIAASHDSSSALSFLLENNASISSRDNQGRTVLHIITDKVANKSFSVIMKNGGSDLLNIRDSEGLTPSLTAASSGAITQLYDILNNYGDQITVQDDNEGNTIFHLAAKNDHRDTIKVLTDHVCSANVNARNVLGQRAVHLAARNGNNRVLLMLIKRGADINCRDNCGSYPIHYAATYGFPATVKLLISKDSKINVFNDAKKTPHIIACEKGYSEVFQVLLDHGADPTLINDKGQNCLDVACEHRDNDIGLKIIKSEHWEKAMENRAYDGYNGMKRLIERLPKVAEAVMDRSVTLTKSKYGKDEWQQVHFDFKFVESPPEDDHLQDIQDKYIALASICQYNRNNLKKHPLIKAVIFHKWRSLLNYLYYLKVITDIIYLFGLSIPIGLNAMDFVNVVSANKSITRYDLIQIPGSFSRNLTVFITVTAMLSSFLFFILAGKRVFLDLMKQNLFEALIAAIGFVYCLPFHKPIDYSVIRIGAVLVFLLITNVILILRNIYGLGLYISMFLNIMKTICKVSVVFMLFILAFAIAFSMILSDSPFFNRFEYSIVTVIVMMIGEVGYYDIFERLKASGRLQGFKVELVLFVAMIFVINIAFANLLVGLAVGDIHKVRETASLGQLDGHLQLIIGYYESFPLALRKKMYRSSVTIRKDKNSHLWKRRQWELLTSELKSLHDDTETKTQESELTELKNRVASQEIELIRMKELLEDVKSDVNLQSRVLRTENKEILSQLYQITGTPPSITTTS